MNVDVETRCELASYLELIKKRADGSLWTAAKWIRQVSPPSFFRTKLS
jgi:glutamate--cysteine ligase catalytic subunit